MRETGKEKANANVDVEEPEVQTMSGENRRLYMPFRFDWVEQLAFVRPERLPEFLRAMCDYGRGGTAPEFAEPIEQAIWIGIERDIKYYRERYERSRENGRKGGRPARSRENPDEPTGNPDEPTGNKKKEEEKEEEKKEEKKEKKEKKEREISAPVIPEAADSGDDRAAEEGGAKKHEKVFFDYDGDSRIHGITPEQIGRWHEQFPALDLEAELKAASAWLDGNRKNRKTDLRRFLTNWLIRTREKARSDARGGPRDFDLGVLPEKRRVWSATERGL